MHFTDRQPGMVIIESSCIIQGIGLNNLCIKSEKIYFLLCIASNLVLRWLQPLFIGHHDPLTLSYKQLNIDPKGS